MELPPLRALQCFEAVARLNSFSKAAVALNVSQSAVSHQVNLLETHLAEALFIRQGRHFEMSAKGQIYFSEVHDALRKISSASTAVKYQESGKIRMAIYSSQATRWLIPRLDKLNERYPEIDLTLIMMTDDLIFDDSVADCYITLNPPKRDFVSQFLYSEKHTLVCGAGIWQQAKDKSLGSLLKTYPLLSVNYEKNQKDNNKDWVAWAQQNTIALPAEARFQHFSHVLLAAEAARYNLGIALLDELIINNNELNTPLIRLDAPQSESGIDFYFVYKKSRSGHAAYQKLGHWLKQQCLSF